MNEASPRQGEIPEDLPDPKILGGELWRMARDMDAPDDADATVVFYKSGYVWAVMGFEQSVRLERDGNPR